MPNTPPQPIDGGARTTPVTNNAMPVNEPQPVPVPAPAPPPHRSLQDQQMAEDIQATTPIINPVFGDAAVRAPLIPRGFDTRNLNDARLLCDAAQTKWDDRQAAIAQQTEKTQQGVDLFDTAVQSLGDFRESIRTVINATASLQARGCTEPVPEDLQKFITHAKSTYTAARKEAYAAPAAKKGYNAAALDEELKALETLRTTEEEQRGG